MSTVLLQSLNAWWPETVLGLGALLVLLVGVLAKRPLTSLFATYGTLLASAAALWRTPAATSPFSGLLVCDAFSVAFRWIALGSVALVVLLAGSSRELDGSARAECLGLLLLIGLGLMLMAEAAHLLMAYLAMELVSLSSYVLVGWRNDRRGVEASLKYLLFGALSSGIMLFGMSLLFGLTGSLSFSGLLGATTGLEPPLANAIVVAIALLLAGLAFKISMVPFHMWTPDVYEGAPTPVTGLLSVGPKAAGVALLVRLMEALKPFWPTLEPIVVGLTIVTMTLGNLAALTQTNVKRLLAYSTIGQAGYLLIGVVVNSRLGLEGLILYLVAYLLMNLGVFACAVAVVNDTGNESLEAFRGLAVRSPWLALLGAICLLSLAGIPPLLGFFGKFLLFGSALEAHQSSLAIAGILNSAIALYYYANIIRLMYFAPPTQPGPLRAGWALGVALVVCAVATLLLGLFPGPLLGWVRPSAVVNL
ncbi:MAG: NADH-quinone oxidoreductase subunit N [Candidatus Omnitrophica bacterium]|nr:NADH-quinone oxidoreductase subunit N [Candidatus Omnitrophota bacterium]